MNKDKVIEAAKLNQLKYVFDDTLDNAKINELKTIGIGNFVDGANWAINKACEWLENNADAYIYNTTPSYPNADFKAKVGGTCWINLKKFMEELLWITRRS